MEGNWACLLPWQILPVLLVVLPNAYEILAFELGNSNAFWGPARRELV